MLPRLLARVAVFLVAAATVGADQGRSGSLPVVEVYKTATCGCCAKWVDHMRAAKFQTRVTDLSQDELNQVKAKHGLPPRLGSCHTALVGGYVVEGHIPAESVKRLLKERPAIAGIAVPGMPTGSPGMEVPGAPTPPYSVLAFDKQGGLQVFATVTPAPAK
jgi:hypothetical protein